MDTLQYVKRLEKAGLDRKLAEAHAEALRDEVAPQFATKAHLDAMEDRLKSMIAASEDRTKSSLAALDGRMQSGLAALEDRMQSGEGRMNSSLTSLEDRLKTSITALEDRMNAKFEAMMWKHSVAMIFGVLTIGGFLIKFVK